MDYTTISGAVDWSSAITAIAAVAALLAAVVASSTGARKVLGMIGR